MVSEQIRVSCASLCRFLVDDRLLLLLNRNRRQQGIYELSPLGGALEADDLSVLDALHLTPESDGSPDLRFFMDRVHLHVFREWFSKREGRETDPFREIFEELVEEAQVLPDLQPADLRTALLYTHESEKITQRAGVSGQLTHYFLEVFEVRVISPMVKHRLNMLTEASGVMLLDTQTARNTTAIDMHVDDATRPVKINVDALFQS